MAIRRMKQEHLNDLKVIVERIESLSDQDELGLYLELDDQFHEVVLNAQGIKF